MDPIRIVAAMWLLIIAAHLFISVGYYLHKTETADQENDSDIAAKAAIVAGVAGIISLVLAVALLVC